MAETFTTKANAFKCPCTRRGVVSHKAPGQGTRQWTQTVEHFEPTSFCEVTVTFSDETFSYTTERTG